MENDIVRLIGIGVLVARSLVRRQVLLFGWHRHSCRCGIRQECLFHPKSKACQRTSCFGHL
jgi:hypothetical protein